MATFEKAYRHDAESAELIKNRTREYAHPDPLQRTQRKQEIPTVESPSVEIHVRWSH
jgi:hypothetical protein